MKKQASEAQIRVKNMPSQAGYKKYLTNTIWMFSEKVLRIFLGLFVTIWLARYLGPLQFGKLNFALSFVALFGIISTLGLDKLLAKELIHNPKQYNLIMGSAMALRVIGAILLVSIASISGYVLRPNDDLFLFLVVLISSAFIFNSFDVIKYWLESKVQAKYSALIDASVVIIGSIAKIILIVNNASLLAFGWVVLLESIILGGGLITTYLYKGNSLLSWRFSFKKTFHLVSNAFPIILAGAVFIMFTRIDQVMLGKMLGDEAVGVYAAAVRISEGWMFFPALVATSLFPAMLKAKEDNYQRYILFTQNLLNVMVLLGVAVSVFVTFISFPFIELIYGEGYSETSFILIVHIWGMIFNAISIISFRYFLAAGLQIYSFYRALVGLILNVMLNVYLIPLYGTAGAAIATVISQVIAAYVLNSVSPKTREMFKMQTKALALIWSFKSLWRIREVK